MKEMKTAADHLERDQLEQDQHEQDQRPQPVMIRNPRIVGPDDFQWWLMLEQMEQG